MRPRLPVDAHAAIDVAYGVVLIVLPWAADFSGEQMLTGICAGTGAAILVVAFLTDNRVDALPLLPMRVHLALDVVLACYLIGLAVGVAAADGGARIWAPLLGLGIGALFLPLLTEAPEPHEHPDVAFAR